MRIGDVSRVIITIIITIIIIIAITITINITIITIICSVAWLWSGNNFNKPTSFSFQLLHHPPEKQFPLYISFSFLNLSYMRWESIEAKLYVEEGTELAVETKGTKTNYSLA